MKVHIHHFHSKGAVVDQAALEQFQQQWAIYQKLVDNDSLAIVDGTLTGGSDVTIAADGSHVVNTTVAAGGLSKGGTGVGGAIAITVAENDTQARLGSGTGLDVTGKVDVSANHHGASATTADGKSSGGTAVGAAIALSIVDDSALASTARNISADGAVSLTASADAKGPK